SVHKLTVGLASFRFFHGSFDCRLGRTASQSLSLGLLPCRILSSVSHLVHAAVDCGIGSRYRFLDLDQSDLLVLLGPPVADTATNIEQIIFARLVDIAIFYVHHSVSPV